MMGSAQEITQIEAAPIQSETSAIVSMIERAAINPAVDIDKMERLLKMQQQVFERNARTSYTASFARMQGELPSIAERGKGHGNITYALWEHVNDAIKPVLANNGFGLSFKVKDHEKGIEVTAILSHRDGHFEETSKVFPADTSGSKNAIQAVGSSISYGKRYTAAALLNLTSHAEDDDGRMASTGELINYEQIVQLRELIEAKDADERKFCAYLKIKSLADLPQSRLESAKAALLAKGAK